jgi:hypothetical protein
MHVGGMLKGASASVGGHPVRGPFSLRPERHTFDDPNNCGISPLQPKLTPEKIELLRELKEQASFFSPFEFFQVRLRTDMACLPSGLVAPLGGEAASTSSLIATDTRSFEIGIAPGVQSLRTRDQRKTPVLPENHIRAYL